MLPVITDDLIIIGLGPGVLTVSGNNLYRVFFVNNGNISKSNFT